MTGPLVRTMSTVASLGHEDVPPCPLSPREGYGSGSSCPLSPWERVRVWAFGDLRVHPGVTVAVV
jgi:hypothetical protein